MGCCICINEKTVLKCTRGVFAELYVALEKANIQEEGIKNLIDEMKFLNSTMCMYSLDIDEFIMSSKDVNALTLLLEKSIQKIKHELSEWAVADLWKFHAELIKYKEELIARGK